MVVSQADMGGPSANGVYYSPVLQLDAETQRTVIQFRDVETGKVTVQYPSERQLEAYRSSLRQRREEADERLRRADGDDAAPREARADRPSEDGAPAARAARPDAPAPARPDGEGPAPRAAEAAPRRLMAVSA